MKENYMKPKTRAVRVTEEVRELFRQRDKSMDNDADSPTLPLEMWERGGVVINPRPRKKQVTTRLDIEILDWLKSKGEGGHLTRINAILREAMKQDAANGKPRRANEKKGLVNAR